MNVSAIRTFFVAILLSTNVLACGDFCGYDGAAYMGLGGFTSDIFVGVSYGDSYGGGCGSFYGGCGGGYDSAGLYGANYGIGYTTSTYVDVSIMPTYNCDVCGYNYAQPYSYDVGCSVGYCSGGSYGAYPMPYQDPYSINPGYGYSNYNPYSFGLPNYASYPMYPQYPSYPSYPMYQDPYFNSYAYTPVTNYYPTYQPPTFGGCDNFVVMCPTGPVTRTIPGLPYIGYTPRDTGVPYSPIYPSNPIVTTTPVTHNPVISLPPAPPYVPGGNVGGTLPSTPSYQNSVVGSVPNTRDGGVIPRGVRRDTIF